MRYLFMLITFMFFGCQEYRYRHEIKMKMCDGKIENIVCVSKRERNYDVFDISVNGMAVPTFSYCGMRVLNVCSILYDNVTEINETQGAN